MSSAAREVAAMSEPVATCAPAPKMTPFSLRMKTRPGAVIRPRIVVGPVSRPTRLSATQLAASAPPAVWSNARVVSRPTLRVFQPRLAVWAVWRTVTVVRPPAAAWVGVDAPVQAAAFGTRPPATRPSGTRGGRATAAIAAVACACWAATIPRATLARLSIDCCTRGAEAAGSAVPAIPGTTLPPIRFCDAAAGPPENCGVRAANQAGLNTRDCARTGTGPRAPAPAIKAARAVP